MRKGLTQLIAAVGALNLVYASATYVAQLDYDECKQEVQNILGQVRRIEREKGQENKIGAVTPIPLVERITEEQLTCIARGVSQEAPEYRVLRQRQNGTILYFERVRVNL